MMIMESISLKEALVVAHGHLSFDLTECFEDNADNDDDGGAAERKTCEVAAGDNINYQRNYCNNA